TLRGVCGVGWGSVYWFVWPSSPPRFGGGVRVAGSRWCGHPRRLPLRSRERCEAGRRRSPRDPRRGAAERTAGGLGDRLPPTLSALHAERPGRLAPLLVLGPPPPGPGPGRPRPPAPPSPPACGGAVASRGGGPPAVRAP